MNETHVGFKKNKSACLVYGSYFIKTRINNYIF